MKICYCRVSTYDQSLNSQLDQLKDYGCDKIFHDVISSAKSERNGLNSVFEVLREGDIVIVYKLDRLARGLLEAVLSKVLLVFAKMFFQVDKRINELVRESNPAKAVELLSEWERDTGLPDECSRCITTAKTIKERQRDVVVKLTSNQVLTISYFLELIGQYGFTSIVSDFQPFICGYSVCGDEEGGDENVRYNILVVIKDKNKDYSELECVLNRIKQAHTNIIFINEKE